MEVAAWCGRCGQHFNLVEALVPPHIGACPRCGAPFSASYTPVVVEAIRALVVAAQALDGAGHQLRDVAPRLHIDATPLVADLRATLDH